jgi:hypothetical protein
LLVLWCAGDRCGMTSSDEYHGRSRRPNAEDRGRSGTSRVLGRRTIGRSDDTMCGMHHARGDEDRGFLG